MNLWIVTVNYGETSPTKSLIDSLSDVEFIGSIKVGIADNSASNESTSKLKQLTKARDLDITIFTNKKNYYYWPAAKKTINNLKKKFGSFPDWIIICNNDITFPDKNFFLRLSEINNKEYPIIGPNITNSQGKRLNPFMIAPLTKLERMFWDVYFFSYPLSGFISYIKNILRVFYKRSYSDKLTANQKVYAVHGSSIIFSKHFFQNGGWIDDNFEMYGEELTVAEIAKKLNMPVTFVPQLQIVHNEHSSTKIIKNRFLFDKAKESHKYFKSVYLK